MMRYRSTRMAALALLALVAAQNGKMRVSTYIDENADSFGEIAREI